MLTLAAGHRIRADPDEVGGLVGDLWHGGGYDAVIPGTDDDLMLLAQVFEGAPPPGVPSVATATAVLDRDRIASAARAAGLDWPDLIACSDAAEVREACGAVGLPVMVKPVHVVATEDGQAARRGAVLAADEPAAIEAAAQLGWPVHVQKVIRGSLGSVCGLVIEGELVACVAAENARIWPVEAGNASAAITVVPPAEIAAAVSPMLRDLGYDGIFQLECLTRPDGSIAPVDLNPRPYGSLALAIAAGADLPGLWVDWLVAGRRPAAPVIGRAGVRFRWEAYEARHLLRALHDGDLTTAASLLRPHRGTTHLLYSVRDPGPAAYAFLLAARMSLRRIA